MAISAAVAFLIAQLASSMLGNTLESSNNSANRVFNAEEAQKTREFNTAEREAAQAFNAEEAQKNRDFQLMMSSTAHQRQVEDLKKAGLNPILSANSGASVGAGATAVSPFGGSSAQASSNSTAGKSLNSLTNGLAALASTSMEISSKMKLKPQEKVGSTQDYYRNGKLVRRVDTNYKY